MVSRDLDSGRNRTEGVKAPEKRLKGLREDKIKQQTHLYRSPYLSEQNNYEIREARMGKNSFIFHIASWRDPIGCL